MQKLYTELKSKGLGLVAVDTGDSAQLIRRFLKEKRFTFAIAMDKENGGAFDNYLLGACPTHYLIDSKGKIVYRAVGFDEKAIRASLKSLGIH